MKSYNFLFFFYGLLQASFVQATDIMPVEQISQQTKAFLYHLAEERLTSSDSAHVKITLRKIDKRLRLSRCDKKLAFALKGGHLKQFTSVKVSCQGTKPWSIYVGGKLVLEKPILVANRELARHHVLQKSDLSSRLVDIYAIRGGFSTRLSDIIGLQLKRALRTGDIIYSHQLQSPDIIKKGDRVTVIAKRGSLSVISPGIALNNASKGEKIKVENQRSSRIVYGKVLGPGEVEIL